MDEITLDRALSRRRTGRDFDQRAVPSGALRRLLWAAQGITDGNGNRAAPSAHALHPLRLLVIAGTIQGLETGLYSVDEDALGLTPKIDQDLRKDLRKAALDDQPWISAAPGIITICADFVAPARDFADQPPFGARGSRYVYIEAGAAAQNVLLRSVAEGLDCVLVAGFKDEATAAVLGLETPLAPIMHLCFGWPARS